MGVQHTKDLRSFSFQVITFGTLAAGYFGSSEFPVSSWRFVDLRRIERLRDFKKSGAGCNV